MEHFLARAAFSKVHARSVFCFLQAYSMIMGANFMGAIGAFAPVFFLPCPEIIYISFLCENHPEIPRPLLHLHFLAMIGTIGYGFIYQSLHEALPLRHLLNPNSLSMS